MRAVCSTTSATGSDENEEIVGGGSGSSSVVNSAVVSLNVLVVVVLETSHVGGKFVRGEIGASLKKILFARFFDKLLIDFDKFGGDRVKEEEI